MELKRAKVIMLPTDKGINIPVIQYLRDNTHSLDFWDTEVFREEPIEGISLYQAACIVPQHLYITTDEEVKKGEYGIIEGETRVYKATIDKGINPKYVRKIIATTDKLILDDLAHVPQPSQAFVEKYCKLGGVDEVMVEYDTNYVEWKHSDKDKLSDTNKLKIDSHNTITIYSIKNSWNKAEILDIVHNCIYSKDTIDGIIITTYPDGTISSIGGVKDWLNKNL